MNIEIMKNPVGKAGKKDTLTEWGNIYFNYEVTTAESSRKTQVRDIGYLIEFSINFNGSDKRTDWTPRLSRCFLEYLRSASNRNGSRRWNDRTVNRIIAHVKTFAKWIGKQAPFPFGNPMEKIKMFPTGNFLEIEKAITAEERNKLLDAADRLPMLNRSRDRNRYRKVPVSARRQRHNRRPWRNRALIYTLIETGMRRSAVCDIQLENVRLDENIIDVREKGGHVQPYAISDDGLRALKDYLVHERNNDISSFENCPLLFLATPNSRTVNGGIKPRQINHIWDSVCSIAGVTGRTPHSARHGVGVHIMEKTGNISAVQRQLGHKNATYSLQYARISKDKLVDLMNDR